MEKLRPKWTLVHGSHPLFKTYLRRPYRYLKKNFGKMWVSVTAPSRHDHTERCPLRLPRLLGNFDNCRPQQGWSVEA